MFWLMYAAKANVCYIYWIVNVPNYNKEQDGDANISILIKVPYIEQILYSIRLTWIWL